MNGKPERECVSCFGRSSRQNCSEMRCTFNDDIWSLDRMGAYGT